jgi:hypothetical protein
MSMNGGFEPLFYCMNKTVGDKHVQHKLIEISNKVPRVNGLLVGSYKKSRDSF